MEKLYVMSISMQYGDKKQYIPIIDIKIKTQVFQNRVLSNLSFAKTRFWVCEFGDGLTVQCVQIAVLIIL